MPAATSERLTEHGARQAPPSLGPPLVVSLTATAAGSILGAALWAAAFSALTAGLESTTDEFVVVALVAGVSLLASVTVCTGMFLRLVGARRVPATLGAGMVVLFVAAAVVPGGSEAGVAIPVAMVVGRVIVERRMCGRRTRAGRP